MAAAIVNCPCFNSMLMRRLKAASLPSAVNPRGSQKTTGSCKLNSDAGSNTLQAGPPDEPPKKKARDTLLLRSRAKARNSESVNKAQSPKALPVSPS